MFIYRIWQGEYEYITERLLSHQYKYTQKEFEEIMIGAINYVKKLPATSRYDDFVDIVDTLINIYGFTMYEIPIQASAYDDWNIMRLANK
jgi:hypothetical protein